MEKREYHRTELLTVDMSDTKIQLMVHCEHAHWVSRTARSLVHVHLCPMGGRLRLNHRDEPLSAFLLPGRPQQTRTITCAPWTLKNCSKRPIRTHFEWQGCCAGVETGARICPTTQTTPVAVGATGRTTVSTWRPRAPSRSMTVGRRCPNQCARPIPGRTVESERCDAEIRQSEYKGASYALREAIPIVNILKEMKAIGCRSISPR